MDKSTDVPWKTAHGRRSRGKPMTCGNGPCPPARSLRLLLIAVALAAAGVVLLAVPHAPSTPAAPASPRAATPPSQHPAAASGARTPRTGTLAQAVASSAAATASTQPAGRWGLSGLAPHGEGVAGDALIQQSLDDAWAADLGAAEERRLLAAGRGLLRADVTGVGRARWPAIFGIPGRAVAPAFATVRFRIQAAVARRDGSAERAVVHLVWAGMDRGGTYTDRRLADWHFVRTSTRGVSVWTPQPRI
ncbi:hypothetical protein [Streptomyces sp. NPDC005784]|uniref:hypothetical protein n=1 Tax=Streptomyces sp. NPDC005784 TaxID=3364731 RepID=UPI00369C87CC